MSPCCWKRPPGYANKREGPQITKGENVGNSGKARRNER